MNINATYLVIIVNREPRKQQFFTWIIAPDISYQLLKEGIIYLRPTLINFINVLIVI